MLTSRHLPAVILAIVLPLAGCGGPELPTTHKVSGVVSFEGRPVDEGTVMFLHSATQDSQQAELGPGGAFQVEVREGEHKVAVEPIVIETPSSATSPGSSDYKKVSNIPARYRSADTSGFTANVVAPAELTFEMTSGSKGK